MLWPICCVCLWPGRSELQLRIDVAHTFNCSMSHDIHVLCVCFILIMSMVSFQLFMHMSVRSFSILYNQIEFSLILRSIRLSMEFHTIARFLSKFILLLHLSKCFIWMAYGYTKKNNVYNTEFNCGTFSFVEKKKQSQIAETIKNAPFENNLDFQQLRVREKERCFFIQTDFISKMFTLIQHFRIE